MNRPPAPKIPDAPQGPPLSMSRRLMRGPRAGVQNTSFQHSNQQDACIANRDDRGLASPHQPSSHRGTTGAYVDSMTWTKWHRLEEHNATNSGFLTVAVLTYCSRTPLWTRALKPAQGPAGGTYYDRTVVSHRRRITCLTDRGCFLEDSAEYGRVNAPYDMNSFSPTPSS
jgi:hypothetical protein